MAQHDSNQITEKLMNLAEEEYHEEIEEILLANDNCAHYSIQVNAMYLIDLGKKVAELLAKDPEYMLQLLDSSFFKVSKQIFYRSENKVMMCLKKNFHVRLHDLPMCSEVLRTKMPKCEDVGKLLSISATVTRTSLVKMLQHKKEYQCQSCKFTFLVHADICQYFKFSKPSRCPNPQSCSSFNFQPLTKEAEREQCKDYQEIRIQEQVQQLAMGTIPRFMWVILEDDLVDQCKAGQDIIVCGVVKQRWQPLYKDQKIEMELVFKAWHVEVTSNRTSFKTILTKHQDLFSQFWNEHQKCPLVARDMILSNFCPQIFGLYNIKLAVALVLAGGIQKVDANGIKVRGDSHLLLVGDPGTGKSQFLKYASKISPRSVLTTGIGSTNAGLTVTAVKDSGEWQLEAGALVLSDGGVCCIDEFNSIREQDRASIHEAMEQQTVSVAKAGLVCKLNTQCSIIAATNPKGKLDLRENININLGIASPLLSRFDLILMLHDSRNEDWDRAVSSYILTGMDYNEIQELWSVENMQSYFALIRTLKPVMSEQSNRILCRYYQFQRQKTSHKAGRTTIRLLESLVRLAQAHARLMFRTVVTVQDAITVISLMDASIDGSGLLDSTNSLHSLFPKEPQTVYKVQLKVLLKQLELADILNNELQRLDAEEENIENSFCHMDIIQPTPESTINDHVQEAEDSQEVSYLSERKQGSKYFKEKTKTLSDKLLDKLIVGNAKSDDGYTSVGKKRKIEYKASDVENKVKKKKEKLNDDDPETEKNANIKTAFKNKNNRESGNTARQKLIQFSFNKDDSIVTNQPQNNPDANASIQRDTVENANISKELSFLFSKDEDFDCLDLDLNFSSSSE